MNEPGSIPLPQTQMPKTVLAQFEERTERPEPPPAAPSVVRNFLQAKSSGRMGDGAFAGLMVVCALSIFVIVLLIVFVLIANSKLSIHTFGFKFFSSTAWDPVWATSARCRSSTARSSPHCLPW
jgi:phosphate transport system permease protein